MRHLVERALPRRFVFSPAQNFRAVPEAFAREMIVGHFHHDLRIDWLPLAASFRTPAARAAGRVAGKAGLFLQRLELFRESRFFVRLESRGEPDVMKEAGGVVEAEKQ